MARKNRKTQRARTTAALDVMRKPTRRDPFL